jgi:hypothetical protein
MERKIEIEKKRKRSNLSVSWAESAHHGPFPQLLSTNALYLCHAGSTRLIPGFPSRAHKFFG